MAVSREQVARAMAYYERLDDPAELHRALGEIAPKAKRMVGELLRKGSEEGIPGPADLRAAREPSNAQEATRTLRGIDDFGLLQALARSIGQRVEALEIVASAEFPEGVRVESPVGAGVVEASGTTLRVLLDNGETWEGPASQARLER